MTSNTINEFLDWNKILGNRMANWNCSLLIWLHFKGVDLLLWKKCVVECHPECGWANISLKQCLGIEVEKLFCIEEGEELVVRGINGKSYEKATRKGEAGEVMESGSLSGLKWPVEKNPWESSDLTMGHKNMVAQCSIWSCIVEINIASS